MSWCQEKGEGAQVQLQGGSELEKDGRQEEKEKKKEEEPKQEEKNEEKEKEEEEGLCLGKKTSGYAVVRACNGSGTTGSHASTYLTPGKP